MLLVSIGLRAAAPKASCALRVASATSVAPERRPIWKMKSSGSAGLFRSIMDRLFMFTVRLSTPTKKWSLGRLSNGSRKLTSTSVLPSEPSLKMLTYFDSLVRLF